MGSRESQSESDTNVSRSSSRVQSTSSGSVRSLNSSRPLSLKNLRSVSNQGQINTQTPVKGPLLALEEKYNNLRKYTLQCQTQVDILGQACGRTIDMLWERARDYEPSADRDTSTDVFLVVWMRSLDEKILISTG